MKRHNLPFGRHAATDRSATGWGNDCKQFKLSHEPRGLASIVEGDSIINATLLYFTVMIAYSSNCLISPLRRVTV